MHIMFNSCKALFWRKKDSVRQSEINSWLYTAISKSKLDCSGFNRYVQESNVLRRTVIKFIRYCHALLVLSCITGFFKLWTITALFVRENTEIPQQTIAPPVSTGTGNDCCKDKTTAQSIRTTFFYVSFVAEQR